MMQNCYDYLKDGEIIALAETAVRKADLKRKKNDEQAEASVASWRRRTCPAVTHAYLAGPKNKNFVF